MKATLGSPREITVPHRKIPLEIPEGVTPTEFFNSPCNLRHLAKENGLLRNAEGFLLYRKAIGHSNLFDTSIILDTSQRILDPLGRPVRRDQLSRQESIIFSRMTQVIFQYMNEHFPDPEKHLIFCGEASLDATWPLSKTGVPSIRMIHNHFIAYENEELINSPEASHDDPNLTGDSTRLDGAKTTDHSAVAQDTGQGESASETILSVAEEGFTSDSYEKLYREYETVAEDVLRFVSGIGLRTRDESTRRRDAQPMLYVYYQKFRHAGENYTAYGRHVDPAFLEMFAFRLILSLLPSLIIWGCLLWAQVLI